MMRGLPAMCAVLVPAVVAAAPVFEKAWQQCLLDAQCIVSYGACKPVAVNRAYREQAIEWYKQATRHIKCAHYDLDKEFDAACNDGRCEVHRKQ